GRIGLNGVSSNTFSGTLSAKGGDGNFYQGGAAGTIYLDTATRNNLVLGGGGHMSSLRLGSDGVNNYTFGNLTVQNWGLLGISGNATMNGTVGGAATINVLTSINIQSGGAIRADALGFISGGNSIGLYGPGTGGSSSASHGGAASGSLITYGSITNPI